MVALLAPVQAEPQQRPTGRAAVGLGVAIFGAIAGSPARADHFIAALRWLGVAASISWLLVAALIYSVARGREGER